MVPLGATWKIQKRQLAIEPFKVLLGLDLDVRSGESSDTDSLMFSTVFLASLSNVEVRYYLINVTQSANFRV